MGRHVRIVLLLLAVAAGAYTAYEPHRSSQLPVIADEYAHIALAEQLRNEGELPFTNPYFAPEIPHAILESGFHFLLAGLFTILGEDPERYYQYFVPIAFAINALLLYYLVRRWTGEYWAALFAVLFFGTITSTNAVLAHEFFLPLTLGIGLLLCGHIVFDRLRATRTRRDLLLLGALLFLMAVCYPPALFFFLGTITLYLLSMDHTLPESLGYARGPFFAAVLFALLLGGLAFLGGLAYLGLVDYIVFSASWDIAHLSASPIFYFGQIPSVLAGVGLLALAFGDRARSHIIIYWFILALGGIYVFYLTGVSALLPFPRLFIFYLIGISVLAGIGLAALRQPAERFLGKRYGMVVFACIAVLLIAAQYYKAGVDRYTYPEILRPGTAEALEVLKEDLPPGVVISESITSRAIYPVTGNHVVGLLSSNIGGGDPAGAQRFLGGDCTDKIATLEQLRPFTLRGTDNPPPLYVLSRQPQNCPYLEPEYVSVPYLYSFNDTVLTAERVKLRTERLTPPESYTMPDVPVLTGESLHSFLADTTISTDTWIEYLAPDGTIRGRPGSAYEGYWRVDGPLYCYYYPINDTGACNTIAVSDDTVTYFDLDGNKTDTAHAQPGNPEGL